MERMATGWTVASRSSWGQGGFLGFIFRAWKNLCSVLIATERLKGQEGWEKGILTE